MNDETHDLIDALDDILDEEREALLSGDLEKIGRLVERKETLIDRLNQIETAEAVALRDLQKKMHRNQGLLDGALEGIRTVASRLSLLRRVRLTLETYDSTGVKQTIDCPKDGTLEKRA
jgi:hypothetical protein